MYAMALTDHGNMYGIKELVDNVKKENGKVKDQIKDAEAEKAKIETQIKAVESGEPQPEPSQDENATPPLTLEELQTKLTELNAQVESGVERAGGKFETADI